MDLHKLRTEYSEGSLDVESVFPCPYQQFETWFKDARDCGIIEPNAMILATADVDTGPTARTVLLKYFDRSGFVFFTNYNSRKAIHIEANPNVALLFPWFAIQRQVEINGQVEKVSTAESIKYFAKRPRGSQLGAWVSQQSSVISARSLLQNKLADFKKQFSSGDIPKPASWGGFRVKPQRFEFWQGGRDRLHDRIEYSQDVEESSWRIQRLSP